jgi:hypothetical protein
MKTIFIHCPKTGGCSISKMIGGSHSKIKNQNVIDGHRTILHYKQNYKLRDYFIFTITRNPWDRMVSCYHYVQNRIERKKIDTSEIRGAFWLKTKHKTFEDFIINLYEIYLNSGLGNILPSLKNKGPDPGLKNIVDCISIDNKIGVDFIINMHTLQEDWETLSKVIKIKSDIIHINRSIHEDYRKYYNTKLIEMVEKIYKSDVDYFNFVFEDKFYSNFNRAINKSLFLSKKYE